MTRFVGGLAGSAYAPEVGAVIVAEPKRGSKAVSSEGLRRTQRHIVVVLWRFRGGVARGYVEGGLLKIKMSGWRV